MRQSFTEGERGERKYSKLRHEGKRKRVGNLEKLLMLRFFGGEIMTQCARHISDLLPSFGFLRREENEVLEARDAGHSVSKRRQLNCASSRWQIR